MEPQPQEKKKLRDEVRERTLGYIVGAFGLVAGLAWNDAIRALIEKIFPKEGDSISAQFLYAAIITLAVIILTTYLMRWAERNKN